MVQKSCVTNCNGDYNAKRELKTLRFPQNLEERKR